METQDKRKSICHIYYHRFFELDLLRGCAIAIMIFFHILWDLDYFNIITIDNTIYQYNRLFSPIFFLLVGMCLAISVERKTSMKAKINHLLSRGLWILGLGILLSILSFVFISEKPIYFGVLHCIGLSIICSIPFLKFKSYNMIFASCILLMGSFVGSLSIENPTLFHLVLGLHQSNVWSYTIDYFPIFPWFGVVLFGIALGNLLYTGCERRVRIPDISKYRPVKLFSWLGQHSLSIYLLHQPVIAGTIAIFTLL